MDETTKTQHESVEAVFAAQPIQDEMLQARFEKFKSIAKVFSHAVVDLVPAGVEQDEALMLIRHAVAVAESGIRLGQPKGRPRITAARVSEADAVALRDKNV